MSSIIQDTPLVVGRSEFVSVVVLNLFPLCPVVPVKDDDDILMEATSPDGRIWWAAGRWEEGHQKSAQRPDGDTGKGIGAGWRGRRDVGWGSKGRGARGKHQERGSCLGRSWVLCCRAEWYRGSVCPGSAHLPHCGAVGLRFQEPQSPCPQMPYLEALSIG